MNVDTIDETCSMANKFLYMLVNIFCEATNEGDSIYFFIVSDKLGYFKLIKIAMEVVRETRSNLIWKYLLSLKNIPF